MTILYQIPIKYLSGYYNTSPNVIRDCFLGQVLVQGNTHLWFLPALFIIFILTYFTIKYVNINSNIILFIMFIISFVSSDIGIPISAIKEGFGFM